MSTKAKMRFTILGCGSSPGVPRINGEWGACDPENPKNRRLRCSLLVEKISPAGTTTVVIDTSPDFRQQMLAANVKQLDAVLYTHPHADHIHGIDDLRQYALFQKKRMPVYGDAPTLAHLKQSFSYCFKTAEGSMYPPICEANEIVAGEPVMINGQGGSITAMPIKQQHGSIHSLAFRFDKFAYSSDVSGLSDNSASLLKDLDVWIIDALQNREHVSHFSVTQALEWIARLAPQKAYLTHMHIPLDYETVKAETPDHVEPAYDGLVIEMECSE
jgi:phosphoribosyl 1,2-cyclic phosphate phosphodiesterase